MAGSHNEKKRRWRLPFFSTNVCGGFSHYNAGALGIPMIGKGGMGDLCTFGILSLPIIAAIPKGLKFNFRTYPNTGEVRV